METGGPQSGRMCLAGLWYSLPSVFLSTILGGSLIPIVVYRDGDGFAMAKHIQVARSGVPRLRFATFEMTPTSTFIKYN